MWSPAFLWPGQRIQRYNISVTNKNNGNNSLHMLDASFTDPIVSFSMSLNFLQLNMLTCIGSMFIFSISPVTESSSELNMMQTVTISDWIWNLLSGIYRYILSAKIIQVSIILNFILNLFWINFYTTLYYLFIKMNFLFIQTDVAVAQEFTISAINASVLFKADGTPALVQIYAQVLYAKTTYNNNIIIVAYVPINTSIIAIKKLMSCIVILNFVQICLPILQFTQIVL